MMRLYKVLLGLLCLLFFNISLLAQTLSSSNLSEANTDDIGDEELEAYYSKGANAGLTEDQMFDALVAKGLPAQELSKLKARISNIASAKNISVAGKNTEVYGKKTIGTNLEPIKTQSTKKDINIFGSELFSSASTTFEPNLRIATPSNYILGPDDEIIINVFGFSEKEYKLSVDKEGLIYINNVGPLSVSGLSIEQAAAKIRNKLASTIYKGIRSGKTHVGVSLGRIKSIRVIVIGQANKPGTYTVSSLTTLFNLLYLCGGPTELGSFRNIELIRGNQLKKKVDLYDFLVKGDMKDNVLLEELDIVKIPYYEKRVIIEGYIKRPGKFELINGESLNKLIDYAGNFADDAYKASVGIEQLTEKERKVTDIISSSYNIYQPSNGDVVRVGKILDRYSNRINIAGAVFHPGNYELTNGLSLKGLIEKAGGVTENAYLERGIISRQNEDLSPSTVSFNVKEVISGKEVVQLKKEDFVTIATIEELKDKYTVSIEGEVHNAGTFQWRDSLTVKDLIVLANGFSDAANASAIEISRRIKNAGVNQKEYEQAELLYVDLSKGLSGKQQNIILKPFDIVTVRPLPGYIPQRAVYLNGLVMYPGKYILKKNNERISDLLKRCGGFKSEADSVSITLKRISPIGIPSDQKKELIRKVLDKKFSDTSKVDLSLKRQLDRELDKTVELINIDLKSLTNKDSSLYDLVLEDGDYLSIERSSTLVKVSGEVLYPSLFSYKKGASVKRYIKLSGGYSQNAKKSELMVIYPNGQIMKIKHFLFLKSYPKVVAKSEIVVPYKNGNNKPKNKLTTAEIIALSSMFATLGTLIVNAFK